MSKILLNDALETTRNERWRGKRSEPCMSSQGNMAIRSLHADLDIHYVEEVTKEHAKALVSKWKAEGTSGGTIRKRLLVLTQMGCSVSGTKVGGKSPPQWALNPTQEASILAWLRGPTTSTTLVKTRSELADHIQWTCLTGLRIEETMRQTWGDVTFKVDPETGEYVAKGMSLMVAGTKTDASRGTIRLSADAGALLIKRYRAATAKDPASRIFPESYRNLQVLWTECRAEMGLSHVHTCTLKALRRSAARNLHAGANMPLDMVRQYLRHENVKTTMGYLRIAGGYREEEYARYL